MRTTAPFIAMLLSPWTAIRASKRSVDIIAAPAAQSMNVTP